MNRAGAPVNSNLPAERNWTEGSISGNLFSLAWPMVVSNSFNMLGPTIDTIWLGRLGAAAIAGVGASGMAVMLVNSLLLGLFGGLRAMVARFIGADDNIDAVRTVRQALVLSGFISVLMAIVGVFYAEEIMVMVGLEPDVIADGAAYLRINLIGMVAMSFRMMTDSAMQASGDAMTPMKLAIIFRVFHIVLCPFLVFGWWIFPRMEVVGAALTSVFSQSLGTALGMWILFSGQTRLKLTMKGFRLDFGLIWRIIKIGIPSALMGIQSNLGQVILLAFIAPFGTLAVAGHSLGQRIEMILFMPAWGLGMAAGVLAGQNLGAQQPKRAERSGWLAAGFVEALMVAGAVVILLWAENIIRIFNSEPGLVEMASLFLRIATVGYLTMGFTGVFQQCIAGVGDTVMPMIVGIVTMWLVQLPLAYFLPRIMNLGVLGVRWGIVGGSLVCAIAYTAYFWSGRWKLKKV